MRIIVLVAGKAVGGGTLEDIIDVTGRAQHGRMRAGQFEGRQIVVKRGSGPGLGAVACGAVLPKLTIMMVVQLVAGKAVGGGTLEDVIDVTFSAQHIGVCSSQLESRQVMIKRGSGPGLGAVTGGAVLPKLTIVAIDGLVAGKAVGWGTLIDLVDMTGLTGNAGMGSSQLEN